MTEREGSPHYCALTLIFKLSILSTPFNEETKPVMVLVIISLGGEGKFIYID
ncbi:MAG: hypothetical protein U9M91_01050 [Chloroflexota bacterium]|nr:hypothetical protein [Chloroflexota bacterium]